MRRYYRMRLHVVRDLIGGAVAISAGLYLRIETQRPVLAWVLIVPGALLLGIVGYALIVLPAMIYRTQPKLGRRLKRC